MISSVINIMYNSYLCIISVLIIYVIWSCIHNKIKRKLVKGIYYCILIIVLYCLVIFNVFHILNNEKILKIYDTYHSYNTTKAMPSNDTELLHRLNKDIRALQQIENKRVYDDIILVIAISTFFATIIGIFAAFNYFKIKAITEKITEADELKNEITGLSNMLYGNYINQIRYRPESGYTWHDVKYYFRQSIKNDETNRSQSYFRLGMIAKGDGVAGNDTILQYFQNSKKYYDPNSNDINHSDFYINLIKFKQDELNVSDLYQKVQDYNKMTSIKYNILLTELTDRYSLNIINEDFQKNEILVECIKQTVDQLDIHPPKSESIKDGKLKEQSIKNALWLTEAYDILIPRQEKARADNPRNHKIYFELAFAYMCHAAVLAKETEKAVNQKSETEIDKAVDMFIQASSLDTCNIYAIINQAFKNKQNFERKTGIDLETLKTDLKKFESQIQDENITKDLIVVEKLMKIQKGTEDKDKYNKDDLIKSLYNLGFIYEHLDLLFDD